MFNFISILNSWAIIYGMSFPELKNGFITFGLYGFCLCGTRPPSSSIGSSSNKLWMSTASIYEPCARFRVFCGPPAPDYDTLCTVFVLSISSSFFLFFLAFLYIISSISRYLRACAHLILFYNPSCKSIMVMFL